MKIRLGKGEVVVNTEPVAGSSTPLLIVRAVIESPIERVWPHLDNAGRYAEFMPRVKQSVELSRKDGEIRTRVTVEMPFPLKNMTATTRAKHTVDPGVKHMREWVLEEGDYHINEGSWTLVPFEGDSQRTLAIYRVHVHPKVPIPKMIQSAAQEKAMPKMIEALRNRSKT